MNAIQLLKSDHRKVQELFDELDQSDEATVKRRTFMLIKKELDLHTHLEDTFVYPLFSETEGMVDMIEDFYDDHQELRTLLNLDGIRTDEELDDRIDELLEVFQDHMTVEEAELFPRMQKILQHDKLNELGVRLIQERTAPSITRAA